MKTPLLLTLILSSLIGGSGNSHQLANAITDSLFVGKWRMIEYAGGSVNILDTISFYEDGKMDYPFETGDFT